MNKFIIKTTGMPVKDLIYILENVVGLKEVKEKIRLEKDVYYVRWRDRDRWWFHYTEHSPYDEELYNYKITIEGFIPIEISKDFIGILL